MGSCCGRHLEHLDYHWRQLDQWWRWDRSLGYCHILGSKLATEGQLGSCSHSRRSMQHSKLGEHIRRQQGFHRWQGFRRWQGFHRQ